MLAALESNNSSRDLAAEQLRAALATAEDPSATPAERAQMLMEIARGMQLKPRSPRQLRDALALYQRALALAPPSDRTLLARIRSREGTAHQALPDGGAAALEAARDCYERARPDLAAAGIAEEVAEIDMNLGVVLQSLAGIRRARIQDAIAHYHRALRVFVREKFPREYAILHNNLAIAYLAIPATDASGKLREALAVQSFEQVLAVVNPVEHPSEYAMAQNNLGNALQYAPTSHPLANLLRAVAAYDEALKVRTARDTPVEYANTIANKANALLNLPDDPERPGEGNAHNLAMACRLYREALRIFEKHGLGDNAAAVAEALVQIDPTAGENAFGRARLPVPKEMQ
jgi:tetratricopeptide (TPR) repeat protein